MVALLLDWPALIQKPWLFACCVGAVLLFSFALFLLARWRWQTAVAAVAVTLVWFFFLEPYLQYYLDTRDASARDIVEPFYLRDFYPGYIIVYIPVLFVSAGLWRRR